MSSSVLGKRKRDEEESETWPQVISADEKCEIIKDFLDYTSNSELIFLECSFCGIQSKKSDCKIYEKNTLDITLLMNMERILKQEYDVPHLTIAKEFRNQYIVCSNCQRCIIHNSFNTAPLYSYANGCWIGTIPNELCGLTFFEEYCIARARSTRCTIKLSSSRYSQYATCGNVCVFPQEPKNLLSVLPPPVDDIYDEVAVIFVSAYTEKITDKMLNESPLLVRRAKIFHASIIVAEKEQ